MIYGSAWVSIKFNVKMQILMLHKMHAWNDKMFVWMNICSNWMGGEQNDISYDVRMNSLD